MGIPNPVDKAAERGTSFTLDCSIGLEAVPNPTYSSTTDAAQSSVNINKTSGLINITNAQDVHAGIYTCGASNSQGNLIGLALQFKLYIGTRPTMVTNLDISAIPKSQSDALVLTWSYTSDTGVPVTRFIVAVEANNTDQCMSSANRQLCVASTNPSSSVSYMVPTHMHLKNTTYTVRVRADSLLGVGPEANLSFKTAGATCLPKCTLGIGYIDTAVNTQVDQHYRVISTCFCLPELLTSIDDCNSDNHKWVETTQTFL